MSKELSGETDCEKYTEIKQRDERNNPTTVYLSNISSAIIAPLSTGALYFLNTQQTKTSTPLECKAQENLKKYIGLVAPVETLQEYDTLTLDNFFNFQKHKFLYTFIPLMYR